MRDQLKQVAKERDDYKKQYFAQKKEAEKKKSMYERTDKIRQN